MRNTFRIKIAPATLYILILFLNVTLLLPPVRKTFLNSGPRWVYVLLLSFGISFFLTPVCGWVARQRGILDNPNARKVHLASTPLLGGAAVFFGFLGAIVANGLFAPRLTAMLVAAAVLFAVGLLDDIREIPAWVKLFTQILCAVLVMSFGIILDVIPLRFGILALGGNILLTIFWLIGITNAMNFFDGMDGLAAGLSGAIAFFLGVVAFQTNQPFLGWVAGAVMGACMGFLPYNFRLKTNASIFLGDAGSTVLGFLLACVAVYGKWSETAPMVALASPLLIFWVLIFDMVHITVDRIITGKVGSFREWIDYVGKDHLHHRLAKVLGGRKRSVLFIYLLTFCLGTSAVVLRYARPTDAVLLIVQATVFVGLITILERRGSTLSDDRKDDDRSRS
ncbi:MAG: MraY family glycosyltransferase [Desulfobacterales bacterium]|nr:MraY family glycosyltransferase [Desulfobacterales bacterium]